MIGRLIVFHVAEPVCILDFSAAHSAAENALKHLPSFLRRMKFHAIRSHVVGLCYELASFLLEN